METRARRLGRGPLFHFNRLLAAAALASAISLSVPALAQESEEETDWLSDITGAVTESIAEFNRSNEGTWYLERDLAGFRAFPLIERTLRALETGQYDAARQHITRAQRIAPNNAPVWVVSAELERIAGHFDVAEENLARAMELNPDLPQIHYYRARLLASRADIVGAEAAYDLALASGLTQEQVELAREERLALREPPSQDVADLTPSRERAQLLTRQGNHDQAVDVWLEVSEAVGMTYADRRALRNSARLARRDAVLRNELGWIIANGSYTERSAARFELAQLHNDYDNEDAAAITLNALVADRNSNSAEVILAQIELNRMGRPVTRPPQVAQEQRRRRSPPPVTRPEPTYTPPQVPQTTPGDRAYEFAEIGQCAAADPLFVAAYEQTSNAALLIARADCYAQGDQPQLAIWAFEDMRARNASVSPEQLVFVLRSLGYLYEREERYRNAASMWNAADNVAPAALNKIGVARNLWAVDERDEVQSIINQIDPSDLVTSDRAVWYDLQADLAAEDDLENRIAYARAALDLEENLDRNYRLATALQDGARYEEALPYMERSYAMEPESAELSLALAYAYNNVGRYDDAIPRFQQALRDNDEEYFPSEEDHAYTQLRGRHYEAAAVSFRRVVDNEQRYPVESEEDQQELDNRIYRVRREVTEIERDWYAIASAVYRSSDINTSGVSGRDQSQAQVGAEVGWYPFGSTFNKGQGTAIFARAFESFEPGTFELRDESLQAGIGLRLRPIYDFGLVLTAERLIAIGDDARNAWQFAASHSWGIGGDWNPVEPNWTLAQSYLEAAWIPDDPEFTSAYGEFMLGRAFAVAPRFAVIPHGVATFRYGEDEFMRNVLGEAGLGVSLRYWFDETDHEAPRGTADLQLQYRWNIYDDLAFPLEDDGAFVGRLLITR